MAVTLQQIAEAAGVSRGTVDRALNNRGRIRPEVEEKIKRIAQEMGYQPSRAGRALAMAKRKIRIGVILQYMKTPFMQQVLKGVMTAKEEVESFGGTVKIYEIEGVEPDPSVETVMKGAKVMQEFQPDWIVAMGGGSPIDAAKAMWAFYGYPNTKI